MHESFMCFAAYGESEEFHGRHKRDVYEEVV